MLFGIYVDDLLVTGTNNQRVDDFFSRMAFLKSKDLSLAEKFLGMSYHFDETLDTRLIKKLLFVSYYTSMGSTKLNQCYAR